jgi:hypothetical protein
MDVIALANRIPTMIFGSKSDDDLSDRVNYRYTVALLLLFAVIITTRQFGSEVNLVFIIYFLIYKNNIYLDN